MFAIFPRSDVHDNVGLNRENEISAININIKVRTNHADRLKCVTESLSIQREIFVSSKPCSRKSARKEAVVRHKASSFSGDKKTLGRYRVIYHATNFNMDLWNVER